MRFILMHKTNAHWEAGALPGERLIARVGQLLGELAQAKALLAAEGLQASSKGVRLKFSGGARTVIKGPFRGGYEPVGFSILRVESLDEAIEWASRQAKALGDVEVDIRPVTEAWDIGMAPRPAGLTTQRYMALWKATAASMDETRPGGALLATERMRPGARGRRYKNSRDGIRFVDGPFAESKELIAGYVIVSAESLEGAARWATRYIDAVEAEEVDLLELEDAP